MSYLTYVSCFLIAGKVYLHGRNIQTGLAKHAMWAYSLYFLYPLLLSVPKILASSNLLYDSLHRLVGLILIFLEDPLWGCAYAYRAAWLEVYLSHHCSFCHIHSKQMHCTVICRSLSGLDFISELLRVSLLLKIVLMLFWFPIHLNFTWYTQSPKAFHLCSDTAAIRVGNRDSETLGITIKPKITSQAIKFH
jgi:hypothetical protein